MKLHQFIVAFVIVLLITQISNISLNAQTRATKVKERMDMVKKLKLVDMLGFEDEKAEQFLLKYNSYEKKINENRKKTRVALRELDDAIAKNNSNDIASRTNNMINLQEEFNKLTLEKLRGMKSVLSDVEYAKFVSFENKFVKELFGSFMHEKGKPDRPRTKSNDLSGENPRVKKNKKQPQQ